MPLVWDFPPELESLIFDAINVTEVYDRKSNHDHRHPHVLTRTPEVTKTLLACSSVCKVWRKYALERIFKITILGRWYIEQVLKFLRGNWRTIVFKVDTLELKVTIPLHDWEFEELAPSLKDLRSLVVDYSPQMDFLRRGIVPNLRFLALTMRRSLYPQEILQILREVPRLKILHLKGDWDGVRITGAEEDQPPLPNEFEEISIYEPACISEDPDCWLKLLQNSAESLRTVSVPYSASTGALTAAFRCVGKSVKHLTMIHETFPDMARKLLQLCPNLTHATFDLWFLLRDHETVVPAFPSSLISICLCVYTVWSGEGATRDLQLLADIFLVPVVVDRLTGLQELVLDIPHPRREIHDLDNFEDGMKGLEKRLNVVGIKCRLVEFSW